MPVHTGLLVVVDTYMTLVWSLGLWKGAEF
jgi:hypothetical protein